MNYAEMHERVERIARLLKEGASPEVFMSEEDHRALSVAVQLAGEAAEKYFGFPVPELGPRIPIVNEPA